ncbi:DUF2306 domain-containing protein [Thalassorhabdus alkalitolerans]|uniref:DUF2306 domain-containing protein n=2 Tax=Thalassorhabdus alkalitolerans TaxID=2282697 RepID=A0ABW0YJS3_9BACI
MEYIFSLARWIHIFSGFVALLIFWLPIVTRKGGKLHRRSGWVFVSSMATVSITAFYMGIYLIYLDAGTASGDTPFSWFLIFISILSGATTWYGVRVLRFKGRRISHSNTVDLIFPILLITSSIGIMIYGWVIGFPLLQYFPIVGLFLGGTQLKYWISIPKTSSHWVVEHTIGMLSTCIAAITAFTVFGAPRLLQVESVNLLMWFLPTLVFIPLIIVLTIYYEKKFTDVHKKHNRL